MCTWLDSILDPKGENYSQTHHTSCRVITALRWSQCYMNVKLMQCLIYSQIVSFFILCRIGIEWSNRNGSSCACQHRNCKKWQCFVQYLFSHIFTEKNDFFFSTVLGLKQLFWLTISRAFENILSQGTGDAGIQRYLSTVGINLFSSHPVF